MIAMPGCALRKPDHEFEFDPDLAHYQAAATQASYADVDSDCYQDIASTPSPITLGAESPPNFWELRLDEAIHMALGSSQVLRDMGALVMQSPQSSRTIFDPAIQDTDARFGIDAALSAFDASFETQAFFEKNDRALNNVFFGGGTRVLQQDLHHYQAQLTKRSATGGLFGIRKMIDYDFNNSPGNDDPNRPWLVQLEGEFRQPLLQGAGVDFNRIAGPNGVPGQMNGVLLARINNDISLVDFEISVRNLVNDVENAYWELYYAYRDLDAKIAARDRALETWRSINALYTTQRRGGEAEKEAQAREQYYRLEEEVQNALAGRTLDHVRTNNFRGLGGVQASERRLRRLMGIPPSDGRLIRPAQEPLMAKVVFDWDEMLVEALNRRPELRRQKWQVKSRELELAASRNFLLPRLDAIGRYRFRGLGHDLLNSERQPGRFDNAFQDLTTGDFQEWQLGVEMQMPVGFRQAHAGVRNAELQLHRERAILEEQEKQVAHELSESVAEVDRAYVVSQTSYNRRMAAIQHLGALENVYRDADENEKTRLLDLVLDAQRRLADADISYYRGLLEYTLAVKNVHHHKGSLLDYNEIYLSEGQWPGKAYYDAARRDESRRRVPRLLNYIVSWPFPVSRGPVEQQIEPALDANEEPDLSPPESGPTPSEPLAEPVLESAELFPAERRVEVHEASFPQPEQVYFDTQTATR